jgi:hypothetical protein
MGWINEELLLDSWQIYIFSVMCEVHPTTFSTGEFFSGHYAVGVFEMALHSI